MRRWLGQARRFLLPIVVFIAVMGVHVGWRAISPEKAPAQSEWAPAPLPGGSKWVADYLRTGRYWLGYSYALPLAFAVVALWWYREQRCCAAGQVAWGHAGLSGFLAVFGCFLIGCCGSPMLGVYLSLFGTGFLSVAKPVVAGFTTLVVAGSFLWMRSRSAVRSDRPCESDALER